MNTCMRLLSLLFATSLTLFSACGESDLDYPEGEVEVEGNANMGENNTKTQETCALDTDAQSCRAAGCHYIPANFCNASGELEMRHVCIESPTGPQSNGISYAYREADGNAEGLVLLLFVDDAVGWSRCQDAATPEAQQACACVQ